ncbi:Hypothetical_protein [Hexamita inflata]|uniref:Hypothetical_protein n=1 Tax=Hexamita inflata TaxID=28002 RepID=A0AA86Q4X4_9EUKA|nr:Hypothetical protein HINF_LOCUS33802 [Hexamita inflata]
MFLLWREFEKEEQVFYMWLVVVFSLCYFFVALRRLLEVDCLFDLSQVLGFVIVLERLYILLMQVFITQMLGNPLTLYSFIPTFVGPLIISSIVQVFQIFHVSKRINYQNTHFIQKQQFKPFQFKIVYQIIKSSLIFVLFHFGDALILLFTYNIIVQQSEQYTVSYSVLFILLSNSLNKTIEISFVSVFRPNMYLKRFDRTYSLFVSAFVLFFFNLLFQIVLFSLRNVLFKNIFGYVSDQSFYHSCIDGLIGIFSAYATAYGKAEQNVTIMLEIGTFKLLLSVGLWLVGKYTNSGNAQFSYMLYYYKYCVDIVGAAFYLIILMKLRLRNRNQVEEIDKPQLVLQCVQTIEPISRDSETETKSKFTSRDANASKDLIQSHSQVNEDNKE